MLQVSNKNPLRLIIYLFPCLFICFSCSITVPKIVRFEIQPNWIYHTETQKISNFISVFAMVEDLDPQRSFPRLTLHIIGHDLFWEIPISNEDLHHKTCSYSAGFLYTPENLPPATYELRMQTDGGVIATERLTINQGPIPDVSDFPLLENSHIFSPAILFAYHQNNFFLATHLSPSFTLPKKKPGESFYLYKFSEKFDAGLVCGPY